MSSQLRDAPDRGTRCRAAVLWLLAAWFAGWGVRRRGAGAPRPAVDSLVILHTNDLHSHLVPFHRADSMMVGGAAARAALIERERVRTPDLILLDAGDVVQGTPAYNLFRGVPDTRCMSLMRYDAVALGNHDLDDGPSAWIGLRPYASFPVLSANVFAAAELLGGRAPEEVPPAVRRGARWIGGGSIRGATPLRFLGEAVPDPPPGAGRRSRSSASRRESREHRADQREPRRRRGGPRLGGALVRAPAAGGGGPRHRPYPHRGVGGRGARAPRAGIDLIVGGHSHTRLATARFSGRGDGPGERGPDRADRSHGTGPGAACFAWRRAARRALGTSCVPGPPRRRRGRRGRGSAPPRRRLHQGGHGRHDLRLARPRAHAASQRRRDAHRELRGRGAARGGRGRHRHHEHGRDPVADPGGR